jgi:hypothetical protein
MDTACLVLGLHSDTFGWLMQSVHGADNLTTFMCALSWKLEVSTSWNPQGLSSPGISLLIFLMHSTLGIADGSVALDTTRGRRHNEFLLLQSHGAFIFKIVWRRADETVKLYRTYRKCVYVLSQHSI